MDIIRQYKTNLSKNLGRPAGDEIDEDTSSNFAEKLAAVIRNEFYTILSSCQSNSRSYNTTMKLYYRQIGRFVDIYFDRIGLKTFELRRGDPISKAEGHMETNSTPTKDARLDNTIDEVIIQPRYFEYHQNDGQVERQWIDGRCTVYKKI